MNRRLVALSLLTLCLATTREAWAHFLFIRIGPPAEAGPAAEVYFSELAAAGDPRLIEKVAHTQLWIQHTPGNFQSLSVHRAADRLRAPLSKLGDVAVHGRCDYGVLARPNQTPFLLRYYPKAVAGSPEALARLKPNGQPLEILARFDADRVTFTVLREGRPLPGAQLTTVDSDLSNIELQADAVGKAVWTPPGRDHYSIYTKYVVKQSGEFSGQHYDEIREFATLAFAWPLVRHDADSEAVQLFEAAIATRANWQAFRGFRASITGYVDGREWAGTVEIGSDGSVTAKIDDDVFASWVTDQLESIAMHRRASDTNSKSPVLRFADNDTSHPLGRLLIFDGGQFASSYRVKDGQITVVNRNVGSLNMTITVTDVERNADGKYLPRNYTVQYWDAATGRLRRTEAIQDSWTRVGNWDLPTTHTVTTASDAGLSIKRFHLFEHRVLNP